QLLSRTETHQHAFKRADHRAVSASLRWIELDAVSGSHLAALEFRGLTSVHNLSAQPAFHDPNVTAFLTVLDWPSVRAFVSHAGHTPGKFQSAGAGPGEIAGVNASMISVGVERRAHL